MKCCHLKYRWEGLLGKPLGFDSDQETSNAHAFDPVIPIVGTSPTGIIQKKARIYG